MVHDQMVASQLDSLVHEYLEEKYRDGEDLSVASYITAAVMFHVPRCKAMQGLPKSQQALKGWRRLCPPRSRMPVPYEVVCLIAQHAVRMKKLEIGLVLLFIFQLYLRPGEAFRVRVQDIVKPVKKAGKAYQHYSVTLNPTEVGVPSKTMQWDEMLALDLQYQKFMGPALFKILDLASRRKDELAFRVSLGEVNTFLQESWTTLKLTKLGEPHLYRLRHGGASHEASEHLRPLPAIQVRGRWETLKSVKNYEKGSRLPQLFSMLEKNVQDKAIQARKGIDKLFHVKL